MALQLGTTDSVFRKFATSVCRSPEDLVTAKCTWDNLFVRFFGAVQSHNSAAFIVTDGLDEAPRAERESLLHILHRLHKLRGTKSGSGCRLQIIVVSRPEVGQSLSFIPSG